MSQDPREATAVAVSSFRPLDAEGVRLLVVSGPDRGRNLDLEAGVYVVGTSSSCALQLTDPFVSRQHMEIVVDEGGIALRDLGSRNGSFFGGARFDQIRVVAGSSVVVGETEIKILRQDSTPAVPPAEATQFGDLIGVSSVMRRTFAVLERLATSDTAVLLQGETGTGKELAAEAIHRASARSKAPFVICDLAGTPPAQIERELFGLAPDASSPDGQQAGEGAFVQADGGTLFLDEVGELELDVQPRLLRVLERRQIKPVGGNGYRNVNVRVIAATNRDLAAEVRAGRFRRDLYHRLAVACVHMPALRDRREDIPHLVEHFLRRTVESSGKRMPNLPPATMAALAAHDWLGNVRELRNVLEYAVSLAGEARVIDPSLLGLQVPGQEGEDLARSGPPLAFKAAKDRIVEAWEREYLVALLKRCNGNVSLASRRAGLARTYLHQLLKKHNLDR